ncbi:hypothetical protein F4777DRAFT_42306 [Nemania sp. FL0916]|nr:hypothetical protein F4777DRAFT_42306 [Nemania sp. FL0916]
MPGTAAAHGVAVIAEDSCFNVKVHNGVGLVAPKNNNELVGRVYFPLPCPPAGCTKVNKIKIDWSGQTAIVDAVTILFGDTRKFTKNELQVTGNFNVPVGSGQATHDGRGIAVEVYIYFQNVYSNASFKSVSLIFD